MLLYLFAVLTAYAFHFKDINWHIEHSHLRASIPISINVNSIPNRHLSFRQRNELSSNRLTCGGGAQVKISFWLFLPSGILCSVEWDGAEKKWCRSGPMWMNVRMKNVAKRERERKLRLDYSMSKMISKLIILRSSISVRLYKNVNTKW